MNDGRGVLSAYGYKSDFLPVCLSSAALGPSLSTLTSPITLSSRQCSLLWYTCPSFFLSTHSQFLRFVAMPAPRIWSSLLASFPLVEYDEQLAQPSVEYPAAPSKPTLWIYGPGVGNSKESFDLQCLRAQAELAFNDIKVERRDMQVAEGSPGG